MLAINKTLEHLAAQKRRSVSVQSCEGLQTCQAIECCQPATSSTHLDDSSIVVGAGGTEIIVVDDDLQPIT